MAYALTVILRCLSYHWRPGLMSHRAVWWGVRYPCLQYEGIVAFSVARYPPPPGATVRISFRAQDGSSERALKKSMAVAGNMLRELGYAE
jgi:hypothetical protein